MYFHESEAIAIEYPNLQPVIEQVDELLATIFANAPLRPDDFSCKLACDTNQVVAFFDLLVEQEVLLSEEMVECEQCQNLMPAEAFQQAIADEDDFECSSCGRPIRQCAPVIAIYRMTKATLARPRPEMPLPKVQKTPGEEPLSERGQCVLIAMLQLEATDSDNRRSTEEIAAKALGDLADANALKGVMSELKTRRLVDSKIGRGGGCWLTDKGRIRAEKLRNQ